MSPWVVRVFQVAAVGNGGSANVMALDGNAVYVLYQPQTPQGPGTVDVLGTMLAQIDRKTGTVVTAGPFPGALSLATAGGSLWVAGGYYPDRPDASFLDRLDRFSLRVEQDLPLPAQTGQNGIAATLAGSGTSLWMGFGPTLYRLSPVDGHTIATQPIGADAAATSLSINPAGTVLYLGTNRYGMSSPTVFEWGTASGALLASSSAAGGQGLGGVQVAAATDGVWVSFATGMMGAVAHLRARDLQSVPTVPERHSNGVRVFLADGVLWTTDGMTGRLACADPATGAIRASTAMPFGGVVIGDAEGVYLGGYDGVYQLHPDPACGIS
ncbi:MAG TPA: hypothetical protein VEQ12_11850 [Candidatus Limnocylindria bacterium]|nr:hypothetical protein [Candidatus Limnocylindria bacterium]